MVASPLDAARTAVSPVQRARKFSAVLGTTSARSSISMRPRGAPSAVMSKNTTGLACKQADHRSSNQSPRRPTYCNANMPFGKQFHSFPRDKGRESRLGDSSTQQPTIKGSFTRPPPRYRSCSRGCETHLCYRIRGHVLECTHHLAALVKRGKASWLI